MIVVGSCKSVKSLLCALYAPLNQLVNDIQITHVGFSWLCIRIIETYPREGDHVLLELAISNKFLFHPAMLGPCGAIRPHYLMSPILRHNYFLDRGAKQG